MIPRINDRGYSFKGVTAYLMHDKQADTAERVAWTETGNLWSNDIHKAAKQMAWTDIHAEQLKRDAGIATTGRKTETGAVYHYSLAWAHEETPDEQHQKAMALETVKELGLSDHQYYFVAHNDTKHDHVHIVVNLTHPETGKRAELPLDKNKVQAWALEYEQERKIYCEQRVENARKRERGERSNYQKEKQDYSTQVTRAYYAADNGKAFKNALELEGLQLANGDRNMLVIVDEKGKVNRLMRQLKIDERGGAKTKAVLAKCKDLDRESLPQANEVVAQIKEQNKPYDREAEAIKQEHALEEAAHQFALEQEAQEKQEKAAAKELARQQWAAEKSAARKAAQQKWGEERAAGLKERRDRLNEILKSIKENKGNKGGRRIAPIDELVELRAKEAQEYKEALAQNEKARKWQGYFDERISKARELHDIDGSKQRLEEARKQYEEYKGVGSRLFKREQFEQAYDNLQNREKQLAEQMRRFKLDIEAIHKNRQWAIADELEKQGFGDAGELQGKTDQDRQTTEAEQQKAEKENDTLREALSNEQSAASLEHNVQGKTPTQKGKVSQVKRLAAKHKEKKAAEQEHTQEKQQQKEKQKDQNKQHENYQLLKAAAKRNLKEQQEDKAQKQSLDNARDLSIQKNFNTKSPGIEDEQARIAAEFEQVAKENAAQHREQELKEMPEFDSEEQRRIWLAFKELEKDKDLEQDNGMDI